MLLEADSFKYSVIGKWIMFSVFCPIIQIIYTAHFFVI